MVDGERRIAAVVLGLSLVACAGRPRAIVEAEMEPLRAENPVVPIQGIYRLDVRCVHDSCTPPAMGPLRHMEGVVGRDWGNRVFTLGAHTLDLTGSVSRLDETDPMKTGQSFHEPSVRNSSRVIEVTIRQGWASRPDSTRVACSAEHVFTYTLTRACPVPCSFGEDAKGLGSVCSCDSHR